MLLAGGGAWAWVAQPWTSAASEQGFRFARVERGAILAAVTSTGTINPISTVIVGSQLSGQVVELLADYNDRVKADQVLARLNADQIRARLDGARADLAQSRAQVVMQEAQLQKNLSDVARARASLADIEAQVRRQETLLADARQTLERQSELARRGVAAEATLQTARTQAAAQEAALDSVRAQVRSAQAQIVSLEADYKVIEAQLTSARATVQQREAVIRQIEVDVRNSEIRSPVDGVVVQRNVELGQTVAASLQAPTLFLVAEDLRTMRIFANVDETDVGRVRPGQTVSFTVNAFPGRSFEGRVEQVRLGSQTVQNVVIYTAVVTVENPGNVLLPGMTANLRILTEERRDVLRVANAALRWRPASETAPAAAPAGNPFAPSMPFGPGPGGGAGAARPPGGAAQGQQGAAAQRQMAEFVEALKRDLALSPEQAAQVDEAMAEARRSARSRFTPDMPAAQRGEAFRRLREEIATQIAALLTPAQREGFEALRERFAAERPGQGVSGRVFVPGPDGKPEPVAVRLGPSDGAFTEVLSGRLVEGDQAIVGVAPRAPGAGASFLSRFGF
jgi:HlyD family secretion protein